MTSFSSSGLSALLMREPQFNLAKYEGEYRPEKPRSRAGSWWRFQPRDPHSGSLVAPNTFFMVEKIAVVIPDLRFRLIRRAPTGRPNERKMKPPFLAVHEISEISLVPIYSITVID